MNKLIPLWENILVQVVPQESVSALGIILPDSNEKPGYGTVIAVWEDKQLDNGTISKPQVSIWDVVYFTKYSPDEVEVDGEPYLIIKASSILAKKA